MMKVELLGSALKRPKVKIVLCWDTYVANVSLGFSDFFLKQLKLFRDFQNLNYELKLEQFVQLKSTV